MSGSSEKIRMLITITKEDKEKLKYLAKADNRSVNNYVNMLITEKINSSK